MAPDGTDDATKSDVADGGSATDGPHDGEPICDGCVLLATGLDNATSLALSSNDIYVGIDGGVWIASKSGSGGALVLGAAERRPLALAVDSEHLFVTGPNGLHVALLDGGAPIKISTTSFVRVIATNGTLGCWIAGVVQIVLECAMPDGGKPLTLNKDLLALPRFLVLDAERAFYDFTNFLEVQPLDGGDAGRTNMTSQAAGLALDEGRSSVYWLRGGEEYVQIQSIDGVTFGPSQQARAFTGSTPGKFVAVGGAALYTTDSNGAVWRVSLAGTSPPEAGPPQALTSGSSSMVVAVAADDASVYWLVRNDAGQGTVLKLTP